MEIGKQYERIPRVCMEAKVLEFIVAAAYEACLFF
jgi:hypothetical protein